MKKKGVEQSKIGNPRVSCSTHCQQAEELQPLPPPPPPLKRLVSLKRNHCCSLTPAMLICTLINAE
jgi:hypothetical protein